VVEMEIEGIQYHYNFPTIQPAMLGATVKAIAKSLHKSGQQLEPPSLLYAEKRGGFSCRTCEYAKPTNATHGRCDIMIGTINLDEGCCLAWAADPVQLHLYREPQSEGLS
jgi:hypothetical protein